MKTPDITDLRLEVLTEFQKIAQEFAQDLAEPLMSNAIAMRWITMPNEQKEALKLQMPKTYAKIMSLIK